jgi:hypothetical protein
MFHPAPLQLHMVPVIYDSFCDSAGVLHFPCRKCSTLRYSEDQAENQHVQSHTFHNPSLPLYLHFGMLTWSVSL